MLGRFELGITGHYRASRRHSEDGATIDDPPFVVVYGLPRCEVCADVLCRESKFAGVRCQFRSHEWRSSWAISLPSLSSDAMVLKHFVHIESNDASRFSLWANRVVIVERSVQSAAFGRE
jgi:hypothetical protein